MTLYEVTPSTTVIVGGHTAGSLISLLKYEEYDSHNLLNVENMYFSRNKLLLQGQSVCNSTKCFVSSNI